MKHTISCASMIALCFLLPFEQRQQAAPNEPERTSSKIVARLSLTGQTSSIPPYTIFTPTTDGSFRVSVYTEIITPTWSGGFLCGNLYWYDDSPFLEQTSLMTGPNTPTGTGTFVPTACLNTQGPNGPSGNIASREIVIRAKATKPLTIETLLNVGVIPPFAYTVHIIVEQL